MFRMSIVYRNIMRNNFKSLTPLFFLQESQRFKIFIFFLQILVTWRRFILGSARVFEVFLRLHGVQGGPSGTISQPWASTAQNSLFAPAKNAAKPRVPSMSRFGTVRAAGVLFYLTRPAYREDFDRLKEFLLSVLLPLLPS